MSTEHFLRNWKTCCTFFSEIRLSADSAAELLGMTTRLLIDHEADVEGTDPLAIKGFFLDIFYNSQTLGRIDNLVTDFERIHSA